MDILLNSVGNLLYEHRYIFSFLGAFFEGNYIMIVTGVLYKFGYFKFWGLVAVLSSGYFLGAVMYYFIGRVAGNRILEKWTKKGRVTRNFLLKLENYFKKHSVKTVFLARITYGLGIIILIMAGSFKMKWKKFLLASLVGSIVWVFIALSLGYVFGISYEVLSKITKTIAVGLAAAVFVIIGLIFFFIIYWLIRLFKKRFIKKLDNNRVQFIKKIGTVINNFINNNHDKTKQNRKRDEN